MNFIGKCLNSHELGPNIQSGLLSRNRSRVHCFDRAPLSERCHKLANRTLRSCDRTASRPDDPQLIFRFRFRCPRAGGAAASQHLSMRSPLLADCVEKVLFR